MGMGDRAAEVAHGEGGHFETSLITKIIGDRSHGLGAAGAQFGPKSVQNQNF